MLAALFSSHGCHLPFDVGLCAVNKATDLGQDVTHSGLIHPYKNMGKGDTASGSDLCLTFGGRGRGCGGLSGVQGQSPGSGSGGQSPPEAVSFSVYSGPKNRVL